MTESSSQARFRMLETVREFSVARRDETGETDRTTDRFLAWARDFGVDHHDAVFGPDAFAAAERIRAEQDNLGLALRTGLVRDDDAAVAVTAALAGLWSVDANYPRMVALIEDTGWILSHYRPGPDLVDVARSAATVCAMNAFMIQGPRATRALAAVRRLPEPDPTTLVGAIAILLRLAAVDDRSRLLALGDSDSTPLLAGVANCAVSYIWESEGDTDAALDAARRMLTAIEGQPSPWASILAHLRISELCLHVERGAEAREHLRVALDTLEASGPWSDVLQIRWALALAALQVGEIDEAEQWLALAAKHGGTDAPGMVTFDLGIRAEIQLARGRVEAGLRLWRRAVDELAKTASPMGPTDAADGDPWSSWAVGMRAVAVVAHGRHGRIDLVEDVVDDLTGALAEMLTDPVHFTPSVVIPICGAGLLALAVVDLDHGQRVGDERVVASGVRLVALAERFRFLREFQPTMSRARAREAAESADGPTYADAVSTYAGLSTAELPVAALAVLRDRASSPAPG
jgi:tetratricopeptide (TPR) repeat protein